MPCDQINLLSVEFKARNRELLKRAIEEMGFRSMDIGTDIIHVVGARIEINTATGKAQVAESNQYLLNELKRSYSRTVVEEIARKKKWIARKKSPNEITLTRY